jgi:Neuraminidase (sialidase)
MVDTVQQSKRSHGISRFWMFYSSNDPRIGMDRTIYLLIRPLFDSLSNMLILSMTAHQSRYQVHQEADDKPRWNF